MSWWTFLPFLFNVFVFLLQSITTNQTWRRKILQNSKLMYKYISIIFKVICIADSFISCWSSEEKRNVFIYIFYLNISFILRQNYNYQNFNLIENIISLLLVNFIILLFVCSFTTSGTLRSWNVNFLIVT